MSDLSDAELLALLLRQGSNTSLQNKVAKRILSHYGSIRTLTGVPPSVMQQEMRLTERQAEIIAAILELTRRLNQYDEDDRPVINSAADAMQLLDDMRALKQEHVRVILLDVNQRVIAVPTLYIGSLHGAVIRAAEVFREALLQNCPALILAHNHPCGDPSPSPEDVEVTRSLIEAGKLLDIQLLDHLIVAEQGWRSLKQQGLAF